MHPAPVPPPGRLVSIGTHRLHLHCTGDGVPVVFDAALGASSISWQYVASEVACFARACTYDRAGFGWSDPGPMPRTAGRITSELHQLLNRAGVPRPIIIVGHSYGGLVARLFASTFPDEVRGIVLVDPAYPEDWLDPSTQNRRAMERGARLCRQGAWAARYHIASFVAWLISVGALRIARAIARGVSRGGLRPEDEGVLAPVHKLPPEVRPMLRWVWTQPKFFEALASQIEMMEMTAREVAALAVYPDVPFVTISATRDEPWYLGRQIGLARRFQQGEHVRADHSGHWIPIDEPETVVRAIRTVIGQGF